MLSGYFHTNRFREVTREEYFFYMLDELSSRGYSILKVVRGLPTLSVDRGLVGVRYFLEKDFYISPIRNAHHEILKDNPYYLSINDPFTGRFFILGAEGSFLRQLEELLSAIDG